MAESGFVYLPEMYRRLCLLCDELGIATDRVDIHGNPTGELIPVSDLWILVGRELAQEHRHFKNFQLPTNTETTYDPGRPPENTDQQEIDFINDVEACMKLHNLNIKGALEKLRAEGKYKKGALKTQQDRVAPARRVRDQLEKERIEAAKRAAEPRRPRRRKPTE